MSISEIIDDLSAIKDYFINETNGSYPLSLDEAIKILKLYEADDNLLNRNTQ